MLPNHAPLVVAEAFGTLAELYPGRIDLGLGRAPGTDRLTMRATSDAELALAIAREDAAAGAVGAQCVADTRVDSASNGVCRRGPRAGQGAARVFAENRIQVGVSRDGSPDKGTHAGKVAALRNAVYACRLDGVERLS